MRLNKFTIFISFSFIFILISGIQAEENNQILNIPSADEIMPQYYTAFYAPAKDSRIEARLDLIDSKGTKRTRRLTIWRLNLNPEGTLQKVLIYFHEPPDVRGLSIMVWKYPDRDDDRWMFIPALNMIRRLSARDYSQSFVGSDFTYEDGTGRDVSIDTHRFVREEALKGTPCYIVETTPGSKSSWTRQVIWIDKNTLLPKRQEFYNVNNKLERVFSGEPAEVIKTSNGNGAFPTMLKRKMENVLTGHHSVFSFLSVEYNIGLKESDFTERYMKHPPRFKSE